ncbi:MAG: tRNA pseudouridine(55) synthase TruB [Pyrinomonadaceae bacterium]
MDGILIIDKPAGITSHDVIARVRRILKTKRVGHTGTLDPFATGVMVILVGQATRLAQFLDKDRKEYEAVFGFGFETDTGDRTGMRLPGSFESPRSAVDVTAVLDAFRGEIQQKPPMFSAKKVDGQRLYKSARAGIEVERPSATVTIYDLEVMGETKAGQSTLDLKIRVSCSAGTYIRSLAVDVGRRAGWAAHLANLRRTRAGRYTIEESLTLDELANTSIAELPIRNMNAAVSHLPFFVVPDERLERTRNGLSTDAGLDKYIDAEYVRLLNSGGQLMGIGVYDEKENAVRPKVVLV